MIMRIIIFIISTGFLGFNCLAQQKELRVEVKEVQPKNEPDFILYFDSLQLEWKDFKMKPNMDLHFQAMTNSGFHLGFTAHESQSIKTVTIETYCYFNRKKSWHKEPVNDTMLKHELYHFKITGYCYKLLLQELKEYNYTYKNNMQEAAALFAKYEKMSRQIQIEYDEATNHCTLYEKQFEWENKIDDWLKSVKN